MFKSQRRPDESFGDFCARVGFDALRAQQDSYISHNDVKTLPQVPVSKDAAAMLKNASASTGKTEAQLATEAIKNYLG